jgi:IS30 family transposase
MVKSPPESRYGKTLVRPTLTLDRDLIAGLRPSGAFIREIAAQLQVSSATVHNALRRC